MGETRIQNWKLPYTPAACRNTECVYNEIGICDCVQINKGNSDSKCFYWSNKRLLAYLAQEDRT